MRNQFELLPVFRQKDVVCDLQLCCVVVEDVELPWVILIPKRHNVFQVNHLTESDQILLTKEIGFVSNIMEELFECDQLNIASIGNKTRQLHIHIICRTERDSWWPETVWGQSVPKLSSTAKIDRTNKIKKAFEQKLKTEQA